MEFEEDSEDTHNSADSGETRHFVAVLEWPLANAGKIMGILK